MITSVLLAAFGVFALTDLVKFLLPAKAQPAGKLAVALVFSAGAAVIIARGPLEFLVFAGGIFGLSTIAHVLHKVLSALGDHRRFLALNEGTSKRR